MEKLFAGLTVIVIVLSFSCGFLLYQINEMQSQNSDLQSKNSDLKIQTSQLEAQIDELESQTNELEDQIDTLEKQLEEQIFQKKLPAARAVKITNVRVAELDYVRGLFDFSPNIVYVTVKNYGSSDVDGLTVKIVNDGVNVGHLRAGEQKEVTLLVHTALGLTNENVATLRFSDVILDELEF